MVNLSIAQAFKVLAKKYLDDHPEIKTNNLLREKCTGKASTPLVLSLKKNWFTSFLQEVLVAGFF